MKEYLLAIFENIGPGASFGVFDDGLKLIYLLFGEFYNCSNPF